MNKVYECLVVTRSQERGVVAIHGETFRVIAEDQNKAVIAATLDRADDIKRLGGDGRPGDCNVEVLVRPFCS